MRASGFHRRHANFYFGEHFQTNATAESISAELNKLLSDKEYIAEMKKNMQAVKNTLGDKDGSAATARIAAGLITTP